MSTGEWCLIESDPGVFSALIRDFGVTGVQVEEIFSLDKDSFDQLQPIHGLVFLFKCIEDDDPEGSIVEDSRLDKIYFAKQVITNACATQAIVNVLMNVKHEDVNIGTTLHDFKDFTQAFDSKMRGLSLCNSEVIRSVHNSFSSQQIFQFENTAAKKDDDVFHFIGYVPIEGRLYELDGIKAGPVDLGSVKGENWVEVAKSAIQKRITKYKEGEIHFNLMAINSDRKVKLERQLKELESTESMDDGTGNNTATEMAKLRSQIAEECAKRNKYRVENIRRKHNYLPFIIETLKILASEEKLLPLVQDAKKKTKARLEQVRKRKREVEK